MELLFRACVRFFSSPLSHILQSCNISSGVMARHTDCENKGDSSHKGLRVIVTFVAICAGLCRSCLSAYGLVAPNGKIHVLCHFCCEACVAQPKASCKSQTLVSTYRCSFVERESTMSYISILKKLSLAAC